MSSYAIKVEKLAKSYSIRHQREAYTTLRDSLSHGSKDAVRRLLRRDGAGTPQKEDFWALRDVSFEVQPGERLGIIGRNGAGKTTLLKVLSRITEPTRGRVRLRGRVSSLLEVGTGFHPELTGRENIYLNGAILGMTRSEIRRKFDEIVAFAEVERFLDTPVKRYSSGMYVRLAFSVAAHLEPEILLVDEVLAVGDVAFQSKCLGKMGEVARSGRTILFVSHNMPAVSNLCQRAIWLDAGQIQCTNTAAEVIEAYLEGLETPAVLDLSTHTERGGDGRVRFEKVWLTDQENRPLSVIRSGDGLHIKLAYRVRPGQVAKNVSVSLILSDLAGQRLLVLATRVVGQQFDRLEDTGVLSCYAPSLPLVAGTYSMGLWSSANGVVSDVVDDAMRLSIVATDFYGSGVSLTKQVHGAFLLPHQWTHE